MIIILIFRLKRFYRKSVHILKESDIFQYGSSDENTSDVSSQTQRANKKFCYKSFLEDHNEDTSSFSFPPKPLTSDTSFSLSSAKSTKSFCINVSLKVDKVYSVITNFVEIGGSVDE